MNVTRNSSMLTKISWRFPNDFCHKSKYCMKFLYHKERAGKNEVNFNTNDKNTGLCEFLSEYFVSLKHLLFLFFVVSYCSVPENEFNGFDRVGFLCNLFLLSYCPQRTLVLEHDRHSLDNRTFFFATLSFPK